MRYTADIPSPPLLPPRSQGGDADQQAEAWLAYLYSGSATDMGRRQFSRWIREAAEHAAAYARAEQLWRDLGIAAASDAAEHTVRRRIPRASRRRLSASLAMAATLVLAIGAGWWAFQDAGRTRHVSGVGEIRTVELPDRSTVTLSAASSIVVRMTDEARHVELLGGRAYFDVVPDAGRAFHVRAGATEIRVVGTAFDVNRGPGGVRVSVVEGEVEIAEVARGTLSALLPSASPVTPDGNLVASRRLEAGQKLLATPDGGLEAPERFEASEVLTWTTGRLHYVDTRLDAIVDEVNRYRDRKIVLADEVLGGLRVTASFRSDQTDQLLSGLAASYEVEVVPARRSVRVQAR